MMVFSLARSNASPFRVYRETRILPDLPFSWPSLVVSVSEWLT